MRRLALTCQMPEGRTYIRFATAKRSLHYMLELPIGDFVMKSLPSTIFKRFLTTGEMKRGQ
jgi:hypothetical protein